MSKLSIGLFALFALLAITACDPEPEPVDLCSTDNVTYNSDVKSIFDNSCAFAGCHDAAAITSIGALNNYDNAVAFVQFGRIEGAINHQEDFKPMPYPVGSAKMDQCSIDIIEAWIADGTPE